MSATPHTRAARRLFAATIGGLIALAPAAALAAEGGRTLERPADWQPVMLVTFLTALGLLLVATIAHLYMRENAIEWNFQRPDPGHDSH